MNQRYFKNSDLHLCAYLLATSRVTLLDIEWDDSGQAVFIFTEPQLSEELKNKYYSHEASIDPFALSLALRELKSRLYQHNKSFRGKG